MKFLTINGKLRKDANGKLITVPDLYDDIKVIALGGHILKADGKVVMAFKYTPQYAEVSESTNTITADGYSVEESNSKGTTLSLKTLSATESNGVLSITNAQAEEVPNRLGTSLYI